MTLTTNQLTPSQYLRKKRNEGRRLFLALLPLAIGTAIWFATGWRK